MTTVTTVGGPNNQMDLWQATLCGCTDDCASCCLTMWCPCCAYGYNVEATTGTGCFVPCLTYFCLYAWFPPAIPCVLSSNRTTIRQVYNLPAQVSKKKSCRDKQQRQRVRCVRLASNVPLTCFPRSPAFFASKLLALRRLLHLLLLHGLRLVPGVQRA